MCNRVFAVISRITALIMVVACLTACSSTPPKTDKIEGYGVVLDIPFVFNQGDYDNYMRGPVLSVSRGDITTIGKEGDIDCCFAMAVAYLKKDEIEDWTISDWLVSDVCSKYVNKNQAFEADAFCADYGCSYITLSTNDLKKQISDSIDSGNPIVLCVSGYWEDYNNNSAPHWMMAYGYDEEGIYVADPNGGVTMKIPDEKWKDCPLSSVCRVMRAS